MKSREKVEEYEKNGMEQKLRKAGISRSGAAMYSCTGSALHNCKEGHCIDRLPWCCFIGRPWVSDKVERRELTVIQFQS